MVSSHRQKMALVFGKTTLGKGTKITAIADTSVFSVAAYIGRASPNEVKPVEESIDSGFIQYATNKLIVTRPMTVNVLISDCLMNAMLK